jgi:hypothetical protein
LKKNTRVEMGVKWGDAFRSVIVNRWFAVENFTICSCWELDVPVSRVRFIVTEPMSILRWWPAVFMHGEVLEEPKDSLVGFAARFHTKGFLPHTFQFVATVVEQSDNKIIIATNGDFDGIGTILISEKGGHSSVEVEWCVSVDHPYVQPFLRILKPVFVWNHLWAMKQGRSGLNSAIFGKAENWQATQRPTFPHNLAALRVPSQWRL